MIGFRFGTFRSCDFLVFFPAVLLGLKRTAIAVECGHMQCVEEGGGYQGWSANRWGLLAPFWVMYGAGWASFVVVDDFGDMVTVEEWMK